MTTNLKTVLKNFPKLFLLLLLPSFALAQPCREVVAFFPSWKWYDRGRLVNPATIDYSKYTAINYAFFRPNADGSISPFDPHADKTLLLGKIESSAPPGYSSRNDYGRKEWHTPGTSLVEQAHQHGVKVLISIGGWTMSEPFSSIVASAEKRRNFAHHCNQLVRTYRIDGIDIDWEYPGAKDREGFTLLLQAVRDSLNFCQWEMNKPLLLTADFGAGFAQLDHIDWPKVAPLLNLVNVMTYDYYGSTPSRTNHHSPLFAPRKGVNGYDLHSSIHHLIDRHQIPASKINIGLAFFGRSLKTKGQPGLHVASHRQVDDRTFAADSGAPPYYEILASQTKFDPHWDEVAQVPYLQGRGPLHTFVTYDDERSISLKARYILDHGLAGAIVWDITGDCVASTTRPGTIAANPLANALVRALCYLPEAVAHTDPLVPVAIGMLPQRWSSVEKKWKAPPRLKVEKAPLSKKEKRKQRRLERQRKKMKQGEPGKYFDGGW